MEVPAVAKLSSDDSHLITLPVSPFKVRTAPFEPEQTVAGELTEPPTLADVTVMVTTEENTDEHPEVATIAL
jgi:hypothetical protein